MIDDWVDSVKGFLAPDEGRALYRAAQSACALGPCLEVGSYCGKSTVYLGAACRERGQLLYAVDHHRGSEEHQPGEGYHDPELFDERRGRFDSFPRFQQTLEQFDLLGTVVPMVAPSALAARHWQAPLGLVFIDGGHSMEAALSDYRCWAGKVAPGGVLAIHDVFPDPADGGRAPHHIWQLAVDSGLFEPEPLVESLGILRRL